MAAAVRKPKPKTDKRAKPRQPDLERVKVNWSYDGVLPAKFNDAYTITAEDGTEVFKLGPIELGMLFETMGVSFNQLITAMEKNGMIGTMVDSDQQKMLHQFDRRKEPKPRTYREVMDDITELNVEITECEPPPSDPEKLYWLEVGWGVITDNLLQQKSILRTKRLDIEMHKPTWGKPQK